MQTHDPALKLTYDDFVLFPDDGKRHELIDGEHYVTPAPNVRHQRISLRLTLILGTWLERDAVGELFVAPFDVVFSAFDVVELDLLYLSNARATGILNEKHLTGAPDIAIQIASRGTRKRDETIKTRLYERSGVAEYWVVDPHRDVIRVYSRGESAYGRAREWSAEAGDVLTTAQLPGLEIPLARVFAAHKLP